MSAGPHAAPPAAPRPGAGVDFAGDLNEQQRAAATAPDGPVLVIAAAGTGKTRALTYRVAHLVERGIDPRRVLLLTFTNKAAREMLERARRLVGEAVGGLWGGTFHHMANRLLRRHAAALGYTSDYTILDQDDARRMLRDAVEELGLPAKTFPRPDVLQSLYGLAASTERPIEELAARRFSFGGPDIESLLRVQRAYAAAKRRINAMDFDDLLVNGLRLVREHEDLLARYQEHFLHVLVDEYQDTSPIQAEWVNLLAARRRNLLVVGDDFQSIYSWRGADFRNIMRFPETYPEALLVKLETNYRSAPEILDVANVCIAGNPEQYQKRLVAVRPPHRRPGLLLFRDGEEQALAVVEGLRALQAEGRDLSGVAVLYRAHFHAMELQIALTRAGLPYAITSGIRFFEQAHVKDVCALLRLLVNPGDALAFSRLMELLPRLGRRTAARLWEQAGGRFPALDAAAQRAFRERLPAPARAAWRDIEPICYDFVALDLAARPGEVITRFVDAFYGEYAEGAFENARARLEDIAELVLFANRSRSARDFLAEMSLLTNMDAEEGGRAGTAAEAVRLSTVHQAKGLEWPVVFVLWLTDGMFPSLRSLQDDASGGEAEERRLFYVAATRARDELYLCVPRRRRSRDGGINIQHPSRFVEELPAALVDRREFSAY